MWTGSASWARAGAKHAARRRSRQRRGSTEVSVRRWRRDSRRRASGESFGRVFGLGAWGASGSIAVGRWSLPPVRGRGKSEHHKAACRGKSRGGPGRKSRSMESVTENKPPGRARTGAAARVKRRGKSPPPGEQSPGHDKPHAVQGQTGTPGCLPGRGESRGPSRVSVARASRDAARRESGRSRREMNDHRRGAFSKRRGTEFGLRPKQRGALRETGAPLAFFGGPIRLVGLMADLQKSYRSHKSHRSHPS